MVRCRGFKCKGSGLRFSGFNGLRFRGSGSREDAGYHCYCKGSS